METLGRGKTTGRFEKGLIPWNKGVSMRLSPKSEFKKGLSPWNKGMKRPEMSGENHPMWKGGKTTVEYKCLECGGFKSTKYTKVCHFCAKESKRIRMVNVVQKLAVKNMADKISKKGYYHNAKSRKKMSEYRVNHPEMQTHDTVIEKIIEGLLIESRILFEKQIPLCNVAISDFYLPTFNVAIFCDGCYWHGCKVHKSITKSVGLNTYQNRILRSNGITVLRLWEHDIKENPQDCLDKLFAIINLNK